jgi:hypothetical protein
MTTYESETLRIVFYERRGGADLYISDKQQPDRVPFHHEYEWNEKALWTRDLTTLLGATGAKEIIPERKTA